MNDTFCVACGAVTNGNEDLAMTHGGFCRCTPKDRIVLVMRDLGLTVKSVFIPWSQSREAKPNPKFEDYRLTWRVTIKRNGREVETTEYSAGMASCPSYREQHKWSRSDFHKLIIHECQTGKRARMQLGRDCVASVIPAQYVLPESDEVVWCLTQDADVLNYRGFEDWADSFGYDTDSRKAEQTYRACLDSALKLRAGIGEQGLARLQEAGQDY